MVKHHLEALCALASLSLICESLDISRLFRRRIQVRVREDVTNYLIRRYTVETSGETLVKFSTFMAYIFITLYTKWLLFFNVFSRSAVERISHNVPGIAKAVALFVSQSLNRVEFGSLVGRINAKEKTHYRGKSQGQSYCPKRDDGSPPPDRGSYY